MTGASTDGLIENLTGLWRLIRMAAYPTHVAGITPQQFWLLRHLELRCPLNIGVLADMLGVTSSSTTSACKRLEQAGLVTRTRQTDDERVVRVDLTAQGRAQLEQMRQRQRDVVGRLVAVLDPQEQAMLEHLLARVLADGRAELGGDSCFAGGRPHHMGAPHGGAPDAPAPRGWTADGGHGMAGVTGVRGGADA